MELPIETGLRELFLVQLANIGVIWLPGLAAYVWVLKNLRPSLTISGWLFWPFVLGVSLFGPFAALFFLLGAKLIFFKIIWFVVAISAVYYLFSNRNFLFRRIKQTYILTNGAKLSWLALVAVLIANGLLSLIIGGRIPGSDDTWVHLAETNQIVNYQFSMKEAFFGTAYENRYHMNVMHALQALIVNLSGVSTVVTWYYSHALHNFAICVSFVFLAEAFFNDWVRKRAPLIALLTVCSMVLSLNNAMFPGSMSNIFLIAVAWLLFYEQKSASNRKYLFLLGLVSFGSAIVHPADSIIFAAILVVYAAVLFILKKLKRSEIIRLGVSATCLVSTGVLSFWISNFTGHKYQSTVKFSEFKVLDFQLGPLNLSSISPGFDSKKILFYVLAALGFVLALVSIKKMRRQIFMLSSWSVPVLLTNIPGIYDIVALFMPSWAIQRTKRSDIFRHLMLSIGLVYVIDKISDVIFGELRLLNKYLRFKEIFVVALTMVIGISIAVPLSRTYYKQRKDYQTSLRQVNDLQKLLSPLKDGTVIAAETWTAYKIPSITNNYVVTGREAHMTGAIDLSQRDQCSEALLDFAHPKIQAAASRDFEPNYIVTNDAATARLVAKNNPWLKKESSQGPYTLFSINQLSIPRDSQPSACANVYNKDQIPSPYNY